MIFRAGMSISSVEQMIRSIILTASTGKRPIPVSPEHHRIGSVEYRVGYVGSFGASRPRALDHRLKHLRSCDRQLLRDQTVPNDLLLQHWRSLGRSLDRQIASGDHHAIHDPQNVREVIDCLGLFDLGDQPRLPAELPDQVAGAAAIVRFAHKGLCD